MTKSKNYDKVSVCVKLLSAISFVWLGGMRVSIQGGFPRRRGQSGKRRGRSKAGQNIIVPPRIGSRVEGRMNDGSGASQLATRVLCDQPFQGEWNQRTYTLTHLSSSQVEMSLGGQTLMFNKQRRNE